MRSGLLLRSAVHLVAAGSVLVATIVCPEMALADTSREQLRSAVVGGQVEPSGVFDGDVSNWLSSSYTVKIAAFGSGSSWCATWGANGAGPTYSCTHWWLPSGQADDQIRGSNFDTDAFMIETNYFVKVRPLNGGYSFSVPAFKWTKISDGWNVNCSLEGSTPTCTIN